MKFQWLTVPLLFLVFTAPSCCEAQLFPRYRRPVRPVPRPPAVRPQPQEDTTPPTIPPESLAVEQPKPGQDVPISAKLEIIRRGDLVEELGSGHRGGYALFAQAMGPPKDDSDKWYLSVIAKRDDEPSLKLLADFKNDTSLRAFVSVDDFNQSWSHYNVFWSDDATQQWRWQKIKINTYPVTLIQPPWNKQYGSPQTVVMQQNGYDGNPVGMAAKIRKALEQYSHRMATTPRPTSGPQGEATPTQNANPPAPSVPFAVVIPPDINIPPEPIVNAQTGYDAPFVVPARPPEVPERIIPRILPNLVPNIFPVFSIFGWIWSVVCFLFGNFLTNLLLFLILLVLLLRGRKVSKASTYDLVVDSESASTLAAAVKSAIGWNRVGLPPGPPVWPAATPPLRQGQVLYRPAKQKPSKSQNPKLRLVLKG